MLRRCYHTVLPCQWLLPRVSPPQLRLELRCPAAVWASRKGPDPLHHTPVTPGNCGLLPLCALTVTVAVTVAVTVNTVVVAYCYC